MRKLLLTLTALVTYSLLMASTISPQVISLVNEYKSYSTCDKLVAQINTDFSNDLDKAGAIFLWIANNIKYDSKLMGKDYNSFSYKTEEELEKKQRIFYLNSTNKTIKSKRAVCQGYSELYKRLCNLSGIKCEVILGAAKTVNKDIGKAPKDSDHAWNTIKINGKWYLIDVTWGAGHVKGTKFIKELETAWFMTEPDLFYLNHWPMEKKWLLTSKTISSFKNLPLYYSSFLTSELTIEKPLKGVIDSKSVIAFRIKADTMDFCSKMSYEYSFEKYSQKIEYINDNGYVTFNIPKRRRAGFLTIYVDNNAIVEYKLK